jgi:predicted DCC family thiol-disulfide oxidoreductase YuxK
MHTKTTDQRTAEMQGDVWFIYDGDCPICRRAAQALRIKKAVGTLHLLNARENREHPLVKDVNTRGLNLDDGMALKFLENFYHGEDALHMMALLGSTQGWFNRMNVVLFRSKTLAKWCYPPMRAARNILLRLKGVEKIDNLGLVPDEPLFKAVFGESWHALPSVLKRHYAVRPYSEDRVRVEGTLDVHISPMVRMMARITGMLLAYSGDNIPVTVIFHSGKNSKAFHFERTFHFPEHGNITFRSHMERINDNILVEFMRFGIGWKLAYVWDGHKVILEHRGYVWRVFGFLLPIPVQIVLGKGYAEEQVLSEDTFSMWTHTMHPLFGKTFGYAGAFKITEVTCGNLS